MLDESRSLLLGENFVKGRSVIYGFFFSYYYNFAVFRQYLKCLKNNCNTFSLKNFTIPQQPKWWFFEIHHKQGVVFMGHEMVFFSF